MASYEELSHLINDSVLRAKIEVACIIAAGDIRSELTTVSNHQNRLLWAKRVFESPRNEAVRMLWAVVASNKNATITQIKNATDANIQLNVDASIDLFANGSI